MRLIRSDNYLIVLCNCSNWHNILRKKWSADQNRFTNPQIHTRGVRGNKSGPPSKNFTKLVYKNVMKPQKVVPFPKSFHNPCIVYPPSPKLGKTSWTLPVDFQNVSNYYLPLVLLNAPVSRLDVVRVFIG
jgi:hypothetical protein